jgi:hypothetical protein
VLVSERDDRRVAEAAERLERQTDEMQARSDRLADHIDSVRQDFLRKRNDTDVVGLPPTAERSEELAADPDKHSADPGSPPVEGSPTEAESGAASLVEDSVELPGNPGDEGVHGEDPNDSYEDER